ncbi:SDR family oxidoreductase [Brevibacillus dissolubilis]|uniref:SDR family oxidoreductase n=1 Tax=Brevibacillus dissolubilis TaxID=1844116 RepID=UPI001116CD10|nr:SDR family NAD(P)-dependent oxidoreductase [Brevibacillus dissolubilis]
MKLSGNTILITGGSTGIGLAFTERLLRAGNEVIICGRREEKLREVQDKYPQVHIRVCDVAEESDRLALYEWIKSEHPKTNILFNNAGIQRRMKFLEDQEEWSVSRQEIVINLEAPIHLSTLFLSHLLEQENPAIINVTSGLSFAPLAIAAIYSATKAALHSFTMSLRHQLAKTNIRVIEIVPPAVNTDLGGAGLHTWGADVNEFADSIMARLEKGETEIGFGTSEAGRLASRTENDERFERMNSQFV